MKPDDTTAIQKPDTVYLYGTCLIDILYPQAGACAVQLLQREGVKVIFPQAQTCCGQPAWNSGYRDEALAVARAQLALFPKPIPIIIPSGSCAGMMKVHYPELFNKQPDRIKARGVAERVYELTEFLVDVLDIVLMDLGEPIEVVAHTSCSARREMDIADRIDGLLAQMKNVKRLEPKFNEECCGFGGTFAVKQPEISAAMVLEKAGAIHDTGTERLLGQDCGCLMNIGNTMEKQGSNIRHQHIAEFLWERTSASEP
ncbi:(Fe-S)-binding protein [Nitrosomonas sp.]|uniref:(Fe-S)-binding protein n=1 Tax=Nitrosomonas sp. TaxID=42353 RepID=UPI0020835489|nr:(Fe-S)-binding protein [Nitrosomonas sp.]GJL74409.1 MAG: Fe-S oxidoreductase [Nitrosomonas sp.]